MYTAYFVQAGTIRFDGRIIEEGDDCIHGAPRSIGRRRDVALSGKFKIVTVTQMTGNLLSIHRRCGWVELAGNDQRRNIAA